VTFVAIVHQDGANLAFKKLEVRSGNFRIGREQGERVEKKRACDEEFQMVH
jgi:hypothetical protein